MPSNASPRHWMMFGTFAEQRHFVYPRQDTYDGVLINGNMVAYAPDGIASFVLEKTLQQVYIVDPLTHAFQHDRTHITDKNGEIRRSIAILARELGDPVTRLLDGGEGREAGQTRRKKGPILPRDFEDKTILDGFVSRCLEFQAVKLSHLMTESENAKYMNFSPVGPVPYALIAPYFFMGETTVDDWLPINLEAARIAIKADFACKKFGSVVISQGVLLDDSLRQKIINEFYNVSLDGFLLWIDDLSEIAAGGQELSALLSLASGLRDGKGGRREVINRHGGYFSTMATGDKVVPNPPFSGVSHGPEFGEYRSVVPVGGGIPIARYYVPQLHSRVRYREALAMFRECGFLQTSQDFYRNVCDCKECRGTLGDDASHFILFGQSKSRPVHTKHGVSRREYPTTETKIRCLQHYLQRKAIEYAFVQTASRDQVFEDLDKGWEQYEEVMS